MILFYISLAWLVGLFLGWRAQWPVWLTALVASGALVWWSMRRERTRASVSGDGASPTSQRHWEVHAVQIHIPPVSLAGLCLIFFLLAGIRFNAPPGHPSGSPLASLNGKGAVEVRGIVDAYPELKAYGLELRIQATELNENGEWKPVSGRLLLQSERFADYQYGDLLDVRGKLESPPEQPGFDYRRYLARQGIGSVLRQPQIKLVETEHGNWLMREIYSLRQQLAKVLTHSLPEPQASLANGILFGLRGDIPKDVNDAFTRSGTTHLLAISGQNMTIVVAIFVALAGWALGRRQPTYLIVAATAVWLYALLVGGQPPVIRAAVMASVFLGAEWAGRPGSSPTALALAAAVMAGISPPIVWDVSFQLSFLSMAGLVYLAPRLQELAENHRMPSAAAIGAAASLGTVLATWPVMVYDFGRVSLVGLPATALAAPALPFIMLTSGVAALQGLIAAPLGIVFGWLAWLPLTYMLWIARGFGAVPAASLPVKSFPAAAFIAYYVVMLASVLAIPRWQQVKPALRRFYETARNVNERLSQHLKAHRENVTWKWAVFTLGPIAALVWTAGLSIPADGKTIVSFLDTRDGEAILVRTPAHHYILIDGGGDGQALNVALGQKLPFWQRSLDLVVLTTPAEGHVSGLVEVLERYKVGRVWDAVPPPARQHIPAYTRWQQLLKEKRVAVQLPERGLTLTEGNYLGLETLYPLQDMDKEAKYAPTVLRLRVGDVAFLFTSDMGEAVERELLADRVVTEGAVLKVANHGSAGSTSEAFLGRVNPSVAIITAPETPFQPADAEVVSRVQRRVGADRVFLISKRGSVDFTTDGRRLWVRTER